MSPSEPRLAAVTNGQAVALKKIPELGWEAFSQTVLQAVAAGQRVSAFFGHPAGSPAEIRLVAVLADDEQNQLYVTQTLVTGDRFPSLTPRCAQVHLFEREIAEQFGLVPEGHPWLKPVRYHRAWTKRDAWNRKAGTEILPGVGDFFRVEGEEVHEVAVGPVHAGVIEPGHFRFQCHGERVFHLEIALGYQHRGVEQALVSQPARALHYAETLAGDSTVAHATTYCQAIEALARSQAAPRAQMLRGLGLEFERLANHIGDLGALANDVGFLPTASYCGRIRGDVLNLTALLCGNRFGRGLLQLGGVGFDLDDARIAELQKRLANAERDTAVAVNLLWDTPSVVARFEGTGPLPRQVAMDLGMVGPVARASGLPRDIRNDQPSGIYRFVHVPVSTYDKGDVFSRAFVRWLEIQRSFEFIREQIKVIPAGNICVKLKPLAPDSLVVTLNEGWRGEVCHAAVTNSQGQLTRYKIVDPSFHNWTGLAYALRDQEVSDFPLCNKSYNLSYCGHDL